MQAEFQGAIGTGSEQEENIVQRPAIQQSYFIVITIDISLFPLKVVRTLLVTVLFSPSLFNYLRLLSCQYQSCLQLRKIISLQLAIILRPESWNYC